MPRKGKGNVHAQRARARLKVKLLSDQAKAVPCADCGQTWPAVCMDLHHPDDNKVEGAFKWRTMTVAEAELAKVVVLCACCHRLRHADDWWATRRGTKPST